jgi:chromosome segregation ATPase
MADAANILSQETPSHHDFARGRGNILSTNTEAMNDLAMNMAAIVGLKSKVSTLEKDFQNLLKSSDDHSKKLEDNQNQVVDLKKVCRIVKDELADLKSDSRIVKDNMGDALDSINLMTDAVGSRLVGFSRENRQLKERVTTLEQENNNLKECVANLEARMALVDQLLLDYGNQLQLVHQPA